jgi:hypothetical protein
MPLGHKLVRVKVAGTLRVLFAGCGRETVKESPSQRTAHGACLLAFDAMHDAAYSMRRTTPTTTPRTWAFLT